MVAVDTYPDFRIDPDKVQGRDHAADQGRAAQQPGESDRRGHRAGRSKKRSPNCAAIAASCSYQRRNLPRVPLRRSGVQPGEFQRPGRHLRRVRQDVRMTGWRLGLAHGPERLINEMAKLQQFTFVCAPSMVQAGGVAALDCDDVRHRSLSIAASGIWSSRVSPIVTILRFRAARSTSSRRRRGAPAASSSPRPFATTCSSSPARYSAAATRTSACRTPLRTTRSAAESKSFGESPKGNLTPGRKDAKIGKVASCLIFATWRLVVRFRNLERGQAPGFPVRWYQGPSHQGFHRDGPTATGQRRSRVSHRDSGTDWLGRRLPGHQCLGPAAGVPPHLRRATQSRASRPLWADLDGIPARRCDRQSTRREERRSDRN